MIRLLSEIISASAERNASQEAFRCRDVALNYGELNCRATHLAAELQRAGLQAGDRVAIVMPKCIEMPIAVHGCLVAGMVYVPVDPALPTERLVSVLNDADVAAILTVELQKAALTQATSQLSRAPDLIVGAEVRHCARCIESWQEIDGTLRPSAVELYEADPAYIIYTSGSTGTPKGILHSHGSGMAYARLAARTYDLRPTDRLANFAPLHFDQSTFEFLAGPLAGATTVMVPEEHMRFPASLAKLIEAEQITIWYSVPFALTQLLQRGAIQQRDLSSLRWVLYGGEPFPVSQLRDLMTLWPHAEFSNVYGPAEVNQCTLYNMLQPPSQDISSVPLGTTWAETEAAIVDDDGNDAENGSVGELWISSPTAMLEYWHQPEATAQAFAFRNVGGIAQRFFRTGDLVHMSADGTLHFHGRKDRQVKIRGNRVELDEVEAVILDLPGVQAVAAFAVSDNDVDSDRIFAAVIPAAGIEISPTDIIRSAGKKLPRYAVPAEVAVTDRFPQTTSQKTDYPAIAKRYATASKGVAP